MCTTIQFSKLCQTSRTPTRSSSQAAGYDLFSSAVEPIVIPPKGKAIIPTGIVLALEPGYAGQIASRSSLSCLHSIEVGAGVIDSDYRGNINVILYNHHNEETYTVKKGDKIAQLLIQKVYNPDLVEVEPSIILNTTERGSKGLGNTLNI